ncbi:MAG TPA: serine/threonine-protein kinase, partial [Kofleriaceae bacterium]|nr:serine/threonine-protein kinase [Kofleriaceae bacterium]
MSQVGEGARYVIEQPLGEGGMAVVHLARMIGPAGDRRVAIKQLARTKEVTAAGQARLAAEARLVFRLTHANICQVLDLGENADGTFVVMEYVHGCDLGHLVSDLEARGRRLDVAVCVYVAREVARALDYAHRHGDGDGRSMGLVHGDASPRNVLLSVEGEVKLADFGIARAMGMTAPGTGILGGTPGFIAPEVASGIVDRRSDIYSLGETLARALGERDDASAALRELVLRATARDPSARFSTAGEMERALAMELSRRHPGFTPTVLAEVVRRHVEEREGRTARKVLPEAATDFAIRTFRPQPAPDAPASAPPPPVARTATVVPRDVGRPRRIRRVALALALTGCAVAASVLLWPRDDDDAPAVAVAARPAA